MPRTGNRYSRPLYGVRSYAQELRNEGWSVRKIAAEIRVSKSWVATNTTKEKA